MKIINKMEIGDYIGYVAEPTEWFQVQQSQIDQFAECTLDHQFIHTDPEKAKETIFGSTIAHGFLSLSLLTYFAEQFAVMIDGTHMGINYGFDKVRFISPVKVNDRIRARAKIIEFSQKAPQQYMATTEVTIEIENGPKPALIANWISLQLVSS